MYYLKEEVYFEPLFNSWYAWPYLVAPVQASRHMVNTHQRIMKSFVSHYQIHILASQEPGMAGSDFLQGKEEHVEDIKKFVAFIDEECTDLVALNQAVKELDELLRSHSDGTSIEYLYQKIPDALKGYIELFVDMEHNPSYRLLESLLYKSDYYKEHLQSASFGLVEKKDGRPFVFSTPRVADSKHIQLDLNFNSPLLDKLLAARERPLSEEEFSALKEGCNTKGGLPLESLFTDKASTIQHRPVEQGVRIQYTGHAGFMIETPNVSILVDPVIASRHDSYANDVFSYSQLPESIDYICVTHSHQDHVNIETLLQLRYKTKNIFVPKNNGGSLADPSLKLMLKQLGFNVIEMEDMEEIILKEGRIMSIPFLGEHGDLNIRSKTAWYVELCGKKLFLGADSTNLDPHMYQHIHKIVGDVDLLAIGMECVGAPYTWMYGALHSKKVSSEIRESRRLNGCDAELGYSLVKIFNPKQVFIYALGMEPWFKYFMGITYDDDSKQLTESQKMIELCHSSNIPCEKLLGKKEIQFK